MPNCQYHGAITCYSESRENGKKKSPPQSNSKSIVNGEQKVYQISSLLMFCSFHEQKYHLHSTHEQKYHLHSTHEKKKSSLYLISFLKKKPKYVNMGIILYREINYEFWVSFPQNFPKLPMTCGNLLLPPFPKDLPTYCSYRYQGNSSCVGAWCE